MRPRTGAVIAIALVSLGLAACASRDWPTYRFDVLREGNQRAATPLSDPSQVPTLGVRWQFPTTGREAGAFYSSPIIVNNRVFVGSTSGRFYALDASSGSLLWEFPPPNQPPLLGSCGNFGRYGVMSSASYFEGLVIFGAPDPAAESGMGSARLFALKESNGALVWSSDVVAHVSGCTVAPNKNDPNYDTKLANSLNELHERVAYSSPLIFGRTVYVGTHNAGDNPIQNGKLVAVSVDTGHLVPGFSYASTSSRGGGIWNSPATDLNGVLFTTGNTRCDGAGCQGNLTVNRGLSMLKIDPTTGAVSWQFQAVPYDLDDDPDWSAGVTIMLSSCGTLATSVQKDGWAYAVDTATGACRWQFPPTVAPSDHCKFPSGGAHDHGDTDYKVPGAAWGDVLFVTAGGEALVHDGVAAGFGRLHALNACAGDELHRVRWIADIPHATQGVGYTVGAPTVTGGVIYVTTDQGYVIALADPSVSPPSGVRCSNIDFPITGPFGSIFCVLAGYSVVPVPQVLAQVQLPDHSSAVGLRNEAAISDGRLFVGTEGGHIYMLSALGNPEGPTNACGGFTSLYAPPGGWCQDFGGKCGRWSCVGKDAVTCDTSKGMQNACGGCSLMPIPVSGHGRGDSCLCSSGPKESGVLVCSADKNHLLCCDCGAAPGCGPGSP